MVEKLRQIIEWQVLELIKGLIELGKLTQEQAQKISQHTITLIYPNMSLEEFFRNVFKLDDGHPELSFIVLPVAKIYKENIENPTVEYIRNLIHKTKYDEAIELAKLIINHDIKIKLTAKASGIKESKK